MPEAPQIRLIVKDLQRFVGQKIIKATTQEKDFESKRLEGETIREILVFGKQILIRLSDFTVRYHLLMFGKVKINESNEKGKLRLGLKFSKGEFNFYAGTIYYIDEPLDEVFADQVGWFHARAEDNVEQGVRQDNREPPQRKNRTRAG